MKIESNYLYLKLFICELMKCSKIVTRLFPKETSSAITSHLGNKHFMLTFNLKLKTFAVGTQFNQRTETLTPDAYCYFRLDIDAAVSYLSSSRNPLLPLLDRISELCPLNKSSQKRQNLSSHIR